MTYLRSNNFFFIILETIENIKNKLLKSIKSLLTVFKNRCIDHRQIMNSKTCLFNHINEIELQSKCVNINF